MWLALVVSAVQPNTNLEQLRASLAFALVCLCLRGYFRGIHSPSASWFAHPPSQQMALLVRLDRQRPPPISPSDIHHKWCSPWVRYWPLLLPAYSSSVPLLPLLARIFWQSQPITARLPAGSLTGKLVASAASLAIEDSNWLSTICSEGGGNWSDRP